jgi:hypothetical protein
MGKAGGALRLNDQMPYPHVAVPSSVKLEALRTAVTVAAWVNTAGSANTQGVVTRQAGTSTDSQFALEILSRTIQFKVRGVSTSKSLTSLPINRWVHLAATFDGRTATVYLDGAVLAQGGVSASLGAEMTPLMIGATAEGTKVGSSFNGLLDEVRLYDRALAPDEIAALARP